MWVESENNKKINSKSLKGYVIQDYNPLWRPTGWQLFVEHGMASDNCHTELRYFRSNGPGQVPSCASDVSVRKGRKRQREEETTGKHMHTNKLRTSELESQKERRLLREEKITFDYFTEVQARNSRRCELKELMDFLKEEGDEKSAIIEASLAYKHFLKSDKPVKESVIGSPVVGTPRRSPTIRKLRRLSTIKKESNSCDSGVKFAALPAGGFNVNDTEPFEDFTEDIYTDVVSNLDLSFASDVSGASSLEKVKKVYVCGCEECDQKYTKLEMKICWGCKRTKIGLICGNFCGQCKSEED